MEEIGKYISIGEDGKLYHTGILMSIRGSKPFDNNELTFMFGETPNESSSLEKELEERNEESIRKFYGFDGDLHRLFFHD